MTLTTHPLLVPWSGKSRAITLLPLWAVRPVQSLSACTRVHFTFTFFFKNRMLMKCEMKLKDIILRLDSWDSELRILTDFKGAVLWMLLKTIMLD